VTKIDADKTASEIARMLSKAGARAVMTEYDPEQQYVTALSFKMTVGDQDIGFRLPCDWKPVREILTKGKRKPPSWDERRARAFESEWQLQAVRVAWRIVKDWVEAQLALIETRMVTTQQAFLPYAIMRDGRTLSERIADEPRFLLGDGS
jgi:hypothetical protein